MKKIILWSVILLSFIQGQPFAGGKKEPSTPTTKGSTEQSFILWDQYYRGVENEVMTRILEGFQKENPGVRINRTTKTLDDLKMVLKMAVDSGEGPDVMQLNQGEADMGAFVKGGLVVDLSQTPEAKKWERVFSPANLRMMGYKGAYYGISVTAEVVGFYYNKEMFSKLGLTIPRTFSELETLLAKVKAAGLTPINFGNLDGWPGIHLWSALQHIYTTREELDAMMSGVAGNHWLAEANIKAARKLQEWVSKGYFTPRYAGISYDDSVNEFLKGNSVLMLTGNWVQGEISKNASFKSGFFLVPPENPKNLKAIGGPGIPFVISSKSNKRDIALRFLDYLAGPKAGRLWADNGMLPAYPVNPADYAKADPLFLDILKAYNTVIQTGAMGYYIDWVSPTFYDTCSAAVQRLMSGELTPERFVQVLQGDYDSHYKK